jgi:D-alanyl-D-alanine carboxypeptidase
LTACAFYYKEGGGGGFHGMMRVYPASGIGTVIMTNATGFDVRACLNGVDRQFLDARR